MFDITLTISNMSIHTITKLIEHFVKKRMENIVNELRLTANGNNQFIVNEVEAAILLLLPYFTSSAKTWISENDGIKRF